MKNTFLFSSRYQLAARGWLFGLVWLTAVMVSAQTNYVRNPDFERPLGPDNWQIVYVGNSSASDFMIHGRSTLAHRDKVFGAWDGNYFGLQFKPYTDAPMEAYATQVVSNLTAGATYTVTAWMTQFQCDLVAKSQVYMQAIGMTSASTPYVVGYIHCGTESTNGWAAYSVNVKATVNGTIEVRLYYNKPSYTANRKWLSALDAFYDDVSVTPQ